MRTLIAAVLVMSLVAACGQAPPLEPQRRRAHAVTTWQGSSTLQANKQTVVATLRSLGASDERISLVLAMAMQETQDLSASQRDASKDGTPAANYSAYNMNLACLQKIGWQQGQGPDLNDDANLAAATKWLNTGLDALGEEGFMCFHRGGSTAYEDHVSYGAQDYITQIRQVQGFLLSQKNLWQDATRVGGFLNHV